MTTACRRSWSPLGCDVPAADDVEQWRAAPHRLSGRLARLSALIIMINQSPTTASVLDVYCCECCLTLNNSDRARNSCCGYGHIPALVRSHQSTSPVASASCVAPRGYDTRALSRASRYGGAHLRPPRPAPASPIPCNKQETKCKSLSGRSEARHPPGCPPQSPTGDKNQNTPRSHWQCALAPTAPTRHSRVGRRGRSAHWGPPDRK